MNHYRWLIVVLLSTGAKMAEARPTIDVNPTIVSQEDTIHPSLSSYSPTCSSCPIPGFGVLAAVTAASTPTFILEPRYQNPAWRTTMAMANTTTIFGDFPIGITPSQMSLWDTNTRDVYRQIYATEGRLSTIPASRFTTPRRVGTISMTTQSTPTDTDALPSGYTDGVCATQPLSAYSDRGNALKSISFFERRTEGPVPFKDVYLWQLPGQQCRP